jgi:hypothetical protein
LYNLSKCFFRLRHLTKPERSTAFAIIQPGVKILVKL